MDVICKVIKNIGSDRFELALVQLESGNYCVITSKDDVETISESIKDLTNAMYVFDTKLIALQGH